MTTLPTPSPTTEVPDYKDRDPGLILREIIEEWNSRFPEDEESNATLQLRGIWEATHANDLSEREVLLLNTLLAWMLDLQHYSAGLQLTTEVSKALVRKVGRKVERVKRVAPADKKRVGEAVTSYHNELNQMFVDIASFRLNAFLALMEMQNSGLTPGEFTSNLIEGMERVEEELAAKKEATLAEAKAIEDEERRLDEEHKAKRKEILDSLQEETSAGS